MGIAAKVPKVPGANGDSPLPNPNARKWIGFFRIDASIFLIIVTPYSGTRGDLSKFITIIHYLFRALQLSPCPLPILGEGKKHQKQVCYLFALLTHQRLQSLFPEMLITQCVQF